MVSRNCIDCIAIEAAASFVMEHSSQPRSEEESSTENCCFIQNTSVVIIHKDSVHFLFESSNPAAQKQMDCCNLEQRCSFALSDMMCRALIVNYFVTC